jgi:hypothetical protein
VARRVFPSEASREVKSVDSSGYFKTSKLRSATYYVDPDPTAEPTPSMLTTLADVRSPAGVPYADGTVTIDAYSMLPLMQGPDGSPPPDSLLVVVGNGPPWRVYAREDERLDELVAAVDDAVASTAADATSKVSAHAGAADPHSDRAYADAILANAAVVLPASNGTDDTTVVNAILAASAGKRVVGRHGQTYLMTAPPVVHSGSTLDMYGCTVTIKAGSNTNLLINRAVQTVRRVTDAATTSASQTITSATAAFTAGDVGKTIVVHGAGPAGALLTTTVSAVTNGTTATLTAAASTTTSGTYAAVGNRDANITIRGGVWNRISPNGGSNGWDLHCFRLRHIDGLLVENVTITSGAGKYAVSVGDITDAKIRDVTLSAFSDGIHIQGPAYRTHVAQIRGTTADDTVAITPRDWAAYDEVFGHVEDTLIEDVTATSTAACLVKVLGGSPATAVRRTRVCRVSGSAAINPVIVGDDTAQANTTGGQVDDISIEDVKAAGASSQPVIKLNGRNMSRISVDKVEFDNAAATAPVVNYAPTAVATLDSLIIGRIRVKSIGATPIVRDDLQGTISRLLVDGVDVGATVSGAQIVQVRTLVTDLIIRNVMGSLTGSTNVLHLNGSDTTAQVTRCTIDGVHIVGTGGSIVNAVTATHVLPRIEMANIEFSGVSWLTDLATTTELHLNNITTVSPGAGVMNVRATAAITVRGAGLNLALGAQNIAVAGGVRLSFL